MRQNVDLAELARVTKGFSGADVTEVCQRAITVAISELVEQFTVSFSCKLIDFLYFQLINNSGFTNSLRKEGTMQQNTEGIPMIKNTVKNRLIYTVGHKKRATLFWTITSAFFDGFQHFVYQRKEE